MKHIARVGVLVVTLPGGDLTKGVVVDVTCGRATGIPNEQVKGAEVVEEHEKKICTFTHGMTFGEHRDGHGDGVDECNDGLG